MDRELRRLSEDGVDLILVPSIFVDVNAVAVDFSDTRYVAIDFTGRPSSSLLQRLLRLLRPQRGLVPRGGRSSPEEPDRADRVHRRHGHPHDARVPGRLRGRARAIDALRE